jgi:hypothetical protein
MIISIFWNFHCSEVFLAVYSLTRGPRLAPWLFCIIKNVCTFIKSFFLFSYFCFFPLFWKFLWSFQVHAYPMSLILQAKMKTALLNFTMRRSLVCVYPNWRFWPAAWSCLCRWMFTIKRVRLLYFYLTEVCPAAWLSLYCLWYGRTHGGTLVRIFRSGAWFWYGSWPDNRASCNDDILMQAYHHYVSINERIMIAIHDCHS